MRETTFREPNATNHIPGAECDNRHSRSQMRQPTFQEPNATNDVPGAECDKRRSGSRMRQPTFQEPNATNDVPGAKMRQAKLRYPMQGNRYSVSVGATECG